MPRHCALRRVRLPVAPGRLRGGSVARGSPRLGGGPSQGAQVVRLGTWTWMRRGASSVPRLDTDDRGGIGAASVVGARLWVTAEDSILTKAHGQPLELLDLGRIREKGVPGSTRPLALGAIHGDGNETVLLLAEGRTRRSRDDHGGRRADPIHPSTLRLSGGEGRWRGVGRAVGHGLGSLRPGEDASRGYDQRGAPSS